MTLNATPEDFGEPSLQVAGFQLWIDGREAPESTDDYDGNWLSATAHCGAPGASVWAQGAIVMVTDVESFGEQCQKLLNGEAENADLDPIEPGFRVAIEPTDELGHLRARVEITPDHLTQSHTVDFEIDQSYLSGIISQCADIVREFPVRGAGE